ncbi:hypothetical protein OKA05_15520 [Luteolibacter arcticus]|uniref:Uncharacterized protein n=1 Tax=Luteolibacter arcticus TaxID=1581411 RepID=A0ABT3GKH8_9BACT|nr:hypothetical protein [Luteolibacter arcticus]MCW1923976.1 hypothetical protein [Luteolibacter arcticus]
MRLLHLGALLAALSIQLSHAVEDEATKALQDARAFADSGQHAKALERHEWYHENALRIDPAEYGVRLSFALSDWKELADKYPPALASLKAIRDRDAKALEDGTAEATLFNDVLSINETLGEDPSTIALFKRLDAKQPALAQNCFLYAREDLLAQGDADLFTKYAGDFITYLTEEIARHNDAARIYKEQKLAMVEELIEDSKETLITTTLQLADMAAKQGHADTATKLKELTFKSFPDPRLKP